jgi:hypothetical protein
MRKVYFVVKKVENKWTVCLLNIGVLYNSLSDNYDKRMMHYSLHTDNMSEAQNYIEYMKDEGCSDEFKIVEGKFKFDYDFSNVDILNSKQ